MCPHAQGTPFETATTPNEQASKAAVRIESSNAKDHEVTTAA